MAEGAVKTVWFPIFKTTNNDDGTVTVRGKLSSEAVDFDDQIVDRGLLKKLLPKYMAGWKNIRVNHDGHWPAGKAIDVEWDDDGDPVLTARIVEPDAVRLVREGVLQGFSVNLAQPKIRPDPKARRGRIYDAREISENSLVDRPANPDAAFDIIKAAGYLPGPGNADDPAVPTGWLSSDTSATVAGNVMPPGGGNSADFDSMGDPVLQPGHVRSNAADISVVTMDDRGAIVAVGQAQYLVPYTVESDGLIHWGEPEPLPYDPKALPLPPREASEATGAKKGADEMGASMARTEPESGIKGRKPGDSAERLQERLRVALNPPTDGGDWPRRERRYLALQATYPDHCIVSDYEAGKHWRVPYEDKDGKITLGEPEEVEEAFAPVKTTEKGADARKEAISGAIAALGKGVWTTAEINDLPDLAFAYIAPGGKKVDGKTEPRDLRHLPYKDADGKVDAPHVRNALARLDETDIPDAAKAEARRKIEAAAREVGVDVAEPARKGATVTDLKEAAAKAMKERAYCPECAKMVKCAEKVREEKAAGGKHVTYKGACGHTVSRFEKDEEAPKATDAMPEGGKGASEPPTGLGPKAGEAKGNTEGERLAHTDPAERTEDNLIRQMRASLDAYEAAQRAERQGEGGGERRESAALQRLWHEVGAALRVQRQEASQPEVDGPKAAEPEGGAPDGVRSDKDEGTAEKVAAALLKRLGYTPREVAKAARGRHKEHLREVAKRLSDHIEQIPEDPLEGHRSEKVAFGDGPAKKPGDAPERNDGGPAPAESGNWRERIREDMAEVDELMREVEEAEGELVKTEHTPGYLQHRGEPTQPRDKPAGSGDMDLAAGDGAATPDRGSRSIPKGAGMAPADLENTIATAIAKGAAIGAEQAAKAVAPLIESLTKRLGVVEHMARPAGAPVEGARTAEPSGEYANPWMANEATKAAHDRITDLFQGLPATDQTLVMAEVMQRARGRGGVALPR